MRCITQLQRESTLYTHVTSMLQLSVCVCFSLCVQTWVCLFMLDDTEGQNSKGSSCMLLMSYINNQSLLGSKVKRAGGSIERLRKSITDIVSHF